MRPFLVLELIAMRSCKALLPSWSDMLTQHGIIAAELPVVAILLSALAVGIGAFENLSGALSFDRAAVANGEPWRLFTGHLTHWNWDHLVWDVLMFAVLGVLIESRSRAAFARVLFVSTAAISAAVWFFSANVTEYRGLSGIDSGLFA